MKVYSDIQLPVYQVIGQTLRVHWDFAEETKEQPDGSELVANICREAVCNKSDNRNTIIEKIMASEYSTGAELAAINNGGEAYEAYQAFRLQAKSLADGWIDQQ